MSSAFAVAGWGAAVAALVGTLIARLHGLRRRERVARAAHELRGPLTAARLGLALGARLGGLAGPRLRALELELERATLALDDFAASGRSSAPTSIDQVDVVSLLADCVEAWRPAALARGGDVEVSLPEKAACVQGDRLRIAQALDNLIANAIEHGGGTVEVRGRVIADLIRVEVRDSGQGIPVPLAELIRGARHGRGWRGRGLAIAASIANEHGGRLRAAPSEQGAHLLIELPLAESRDAGRSAALRDPVRA